VSTDESSPGELSPRSSPGASLSSVRELADAEKLDWLGIGAAESSRGMD